jgi:signal transduction histidine kinase
MASFMKANFRRLIPTIRREPEKPDRLQARRSPQDEIGHNLERIRALHEIDLAITSTLDLRSVLETLLEKVELFLPFPAAVTIRLFDRRTGELQSLASRNLDEAEWKAQENRKARGRSKTIVETKRPLVVRNVQTEATTHNPGLFIKYRLVSYAGIPLIIRDEVIGVLGVYAKEEHQFTTEEMEFLTTFGSQAAIAIHNALLYETAKEQAELNAKLLNDVEEANKQLSTLYSVATVVSQSLNIHQILRDMMHKILDIFALETGRIYLIDRELDQLRLVAHEGFSEEMMGGELYKSREGVVGRVFETGEMLIFNNIQEDPEFERIAGPRTMQKAGYAAQFYIPIRVKEKTVGVMCFSGRKPHVFSLTESQLIQSIAKHLGIAVENATLFDEIKRKTEELEKSNRVKDAFLGAISHELRSPLTVVKGYTAMIQDGMFGEINQETKKALGTVIGRADELIALVNSILEVTRIEVGEVTLTVEPVDLAEFIGGLKATYGDLLEKEITLCWHYSPELPVIRSDPGKLRQILQNLINNAIKFTDKGSVTISAQYDPEKPEVKFSVIDTGVGIPEEARDLIFEKFAQVDSSNSRVYEGAGLGLFIAKKFAEMLQGTITVEGELNGGSNFTVILPAAGAVRQIRDSLPVAASS